MDNSVLRKEILLKRRQLTIEQIDTWSKKACKHIINSDIFKKSKVIMVYMAFKGETDLCDVIKAAKASGKILVYPLCSENNTMKVYAPFSDQSFIKGSYGIIEPDVNNSAEYDPQSIDLCLCPLVAFDKNGHRIGMGGGYYDRFLPLCTNAVKAGVAYEIQHLDVIDNNNWDIDMDMIFTNGGIYESV